MKDDDYDTLEEDSQEETTQNTERSPIRTNMDELQHEVPIIKLENSDVSLEE